MVWPIDPRPTRPRRDDSTAAGTWGKECERASLEGVRARHDRRLAISGNPKGDPTGAGQVAECRSRGEAMLCEHNAKRAAGLCRPTSPDSRGSVAKGLRVDKWTSGQAWPTLLGLHSSKNAQVTDCLGVACACRHVHV